MADEITFSAGLKFKKGDKQDKLSMVGVKADATSAEFSHRIQSIGTSEEPLDPNYPGSPGLLLIKNRDTTNYVDIRGDDGATNCVRVKAGEIALFRTISSDTYATANTAAVEVEYLWVED